MIYDNIFPSTGIKLSIFNKPFYDNFPSPAHIAVCNNFFLKKNLQNIIQNIRYAILMVENPINTIKKKKEKIIVL